CLKSITMFAVPLAIGLFGTVGANAAMPEGFVDIEQVVPGVVLDIRYHNGDNFVGARIEGYEAPRCVLTEAAAQAVARVQQNLEPFGLGLKIFDCYRPKRAVAHFARWARDPDATERKADYYPEIDKKDLFTLGYIAERSGHSRGSTLDLTIIDRQSGSEIDMGTGYDLFSPSSWPDDASMTAAQRANRLLLHALMTTHGFQPYDKEWWHFTLK